MLKTGQEHLESLQDGRVVYIGSERVEDVTTHPAFRNAARTVAAIYDMKADPSKSRDADLRRGRQPALDLLFAGQDARRPAAADGRAPKNRGPDLWHVRTFA